MVGRGERARSNARQGENWLRALTTWVAVACVALVSACQPAARGTLVVAPNQQPAAAPQTGRVGFAINVPRKSSKALRRVLSTGAESSTLLVNRLDVSLSGPGFFTSLFPSDSTEGSMSVTSGSIASHIDNVPTGSNRFIKVVAWNGARKLNQIGGVIDVQPGFQNHVTIGLSTTPTAAIIEELATRAPEGARTVSSTTVQNYLDTYVTKPVVDDPTRQNAFDGYHPYRVNPDGVVDYLIANNFELPDDFDATREADQAFVLQGASLRILTDALPVGSRIWLNDPTSAIFETTDATATEYVIPDVAPNFEANAGETGQPAWTLTVLTPTGKILTLEVAVGRHTLAEPATGETQVDIRSALQQADTEIARIYLSPSESSWTGTSLTLNGRVGQQLFVYAEDRQGRISPVLPGALDWTSLDARVQVGNGTALDAAKLAPLNGDTSGLLAADLNDYGLVYPLTETSASDATDLASVRGTLRGTSLTADLGFRIGYLGADTGRVKIDVRSQGIKMVPAVQTLTTFGEPLPFTIVEADAPEDVTYQWIADNPAIRFDGTGPTVNVSSIADFGAAQATITATSSTGRQVTARVGTAFGVGAVNGLVLAPAHLAKFDLLPALNPANNDITAQASESLKAYLNVFMGTATVGATDPGDPTGGRFIWKSSDPFIVSVAGAFPSRTATLTAFRPGNVTLTAIDMLGRQISVPLKAQFDKTGTISGAVQAPDSGITLVAPAEAGIEAALRGAFDQTTAEAVERDVVAPLFRWISLDRHRLEVSPPIGEVFPHARARLKILQPGPASFRLISARTGKSRTFMLNLSLANGAINGSIVTPALKVRQLAPAPPTGSTATLVIARDLGETATLEADDPSDGTPAMVWTAETPTLLAVTNQAGNTATIRFLDYGSGLVRVVNTRTGRWGSLKFDIQPTGKGTGNIQVTL